MTPPDAATAVRLTAYSITPTKNDGTIWSRCGIAFRNPDGSITVKLDTLPLSGRIHLRDPQADKLAFEKASQVTSRETETTTDAY